LLSTKWTAAAVVVAFYTAAAQSKFYFNGELSAFAKKM